jgi:hypothetical protein
MTDGEPRTPDQIAARLDLFVDELRTELGDAASIEVEDHEGWRSVDLMPTRAGALPVSWEDFFPTRSADGLRDAGALQVESPGHPGGRWELNRDQDDLLFLMDYVRSVVAGRVVEVFGPDRSRVEVTLSDGTTVVETGGRAPVGCLPLPGWVRRGRRVQYAPYQ